MSCVSGIQLYVSEPEKEVKKSFIELGLDRKNATLVSDGTPAFAKCAKELGLNHLRCLKHYLKQFFEARRGLGDRSERFVKDMDYLIYSEFSSKKTRKCIR